MTFTAPLQSGTLLANVRYRWITSGVEGAVQTTGIAQPSATFPLFRISTAIPSGAEELLVYDTADVGNYNTINPDFGLDT